MLLKLYNKEHVAIDALTDTKDLKIEYVLSGEDSLEFSLSISDENIYLVEEEGYVRTKDNEYVIKAIDPSDNFKRFSCNVNIEDLVGKSIASFDTSNNNVNDTIRLAIAGTGWILADNNITRRRTVRLTNTNALEVLREVRKVFRVDFRYDAINKIIYVYERFGEDRGVYFSDELNLKSFSIPSDTYDYVTRLYPKGKDGLTIASINNGKEYIENFQYSNKILELIWEDNRYTDVNSLKEDAEVKLDELSKPKRSYQAIISDLAKQNDDYKFLDFFLGDTITLLSKQEKFRDKQRIVKYIQYPGDPSQNSCELGNTTLTFEELQKENEAKNNTVDIITSSNGTVEGSKVEDLPAENITNLDVEVAKIVNLEAISIKVNNLEAANVTITGKLNAIEGEFGILKSNVGVIDKLTVTHTAQINDLIANSATITQLEAVSAKIGTVEAEVGKIETLLSGNLSSENIQAGGITSDKLTIANGFITNAMIANLDVSKINAGDISTSKFRIRSDDGGIEIVGATQQFKDKNNKVRIQMGQDTQGNFNFIIRGEDGTTTLIDHTGIKEKAIADDLIKETMIAQDAIGEKQINYSSFVTGFNKDTNTNTIKSTKIILNNQNQTLDVAFSQLKTQADGTKTLTESHSTTIGVMQGQISTAINNIQIVKDGQTILLKDDYNRTVQTVDSMKSTIGNHTTLIDQHAGQITGVQTKTNELERTLNSFSSRLSSTETTMSATNSKVSSLEQNLNGITSRVGTVESKQTMVDGKVTSLETRMSSAESKITESAITNTVKKSFYTKSETESAITSKGYQTASQVQQTVNAFELKFQESGGYNLVYNSDFKNGDHLWGISSGAKYYFGTGNWNSPTGLGMAITGQSGTSLYAVQELTHTAYRQAKTFTLSGLMNISGTGTNDPTGAKFQLYVRVTYDDDTKKYFICDVDDTAYNKWQKVSITFSVDKTKTVTDLRTTVSIQNTTKTLFVSQIMLEVGSMMSPWCPNSSEVYDGITTIDKEGITVTASNVKSKTNISATGFKITKTDTNEDVFKVNSNGRLLLDGEITAHNGARKSGYFGLDSIRFYNWWADTNEEIAAIYGGKDSSNRRSANMVGRDTVALGIGTASSGSKVLESTSSKLSIYKDTDFGGGALTNVRKLNYDVTYDTWINRLYIRSNQINTNMPSGYMHLNYWKGSGTTSTSTHVKIGNGNNDDANGALTCGNFKATGTKNCIVQTTVGYVGINAYETAECYFGDIGETILGNDGYSYVYIDSIFTETVNTQRKYQVFLSIYGEGTANVIERTPIYFVIKGTPGIEVGYEIKAKRKGYEDYRLEREVNNWKIGENHGLDEDYNHERVEFNRKIENIINKEVIKDIENETLQEFISSEVERSIENIELLKTIEEDILNENIN